MYKISIEYCIKWNYKPEFDRVSKIIQSLKKKVKIVENDSPPRTGAFEVKLNNNLVYSKFETGKFPNKEEIYSWF